MEEAAAAVPTASINRMDYVNDDLKQKLRETSNCQRKKLRSNLVDSKRVGLGEIQERTQQLESFTPHDVTKLSAEIKKKGHATYEDMHRLSHAFLSGIDNIKTFIKVPGALQVLVRALKGTNSMCRIKAAECLCNLSLGDSSVGKKICYTSGSYLVTYLHSNDSELIYLCLWTIQNLVATGSKLAQILLKMKLIPQLWNLYVDNNIGNETTDYRKDAGLCLQLIATNPSVVLSESDKIFILEHAANKNVNSVGAEYHLQIVFNILFAELNNVTNFPLNLIQYLLHFSLTDIYNTENIDMLENALRLLYANRVLGNLVACIGEPAVEMITQQLSECWQSDLGQLFQKLLSIEQPMLKQEFLWCLKNVSIAKQDLLIDSNLF